MAPKGVLIIGYGSPLRGDDAAGPAAADRLREHGFDTLVVHQLTPELAEAVAAAETVIFLDADAAIEPGEVAVERVDAEAGAPHLIEHHASPAGLLRLARVAYNASPAAWLIRMGGQSFEFGEAMSAAAERAVAKAVEKVQGCDIFTACS